MKLILMLSVLVLSGCNKCPVKIGDKLAVGTVVSKNGTGGGTQQCKISVRLHDGTHTDWEYAFKYVDL